MGDNEHPSDIYLNIPEDSESGSYLPYTGLPGRVSLRESNLSAEFSEAPKKAYHDHGEEGSSSSKNKIKYKRGLNPIERCLLEIAEKSKSKNWIVGTEDEKKAYHEKDRMEEQEKSMNKR